MMKLKPLMSSTWKKPTEVHDKPCKLCPSAHYPMDPEAQQIIDWVNSGEMDPKEAVFSCAWRPGKICKGVADNVGYRGGEY